MNIFAVLKEIFQFLSSHKVVNVFLSFLVIVLFARVREQLVFNTNLPEPPQIKENQITQDYPACHRTAEKCGITIVQQGTVSGLRCRLS